MSSYLNKGVSSFRQPSGPCDFHSCLNDVFMTALNETRSNGKIVQKRAFVVEAMEAVIEVAMSASNGSFLIWNRLGLKMITKSLQNKIASVAQEAIFLSGKPVFVARAG